MEAEAEAQDGKLFNGKESQGKERQAWTVMGRTAWCVSCASLL